MRATTLLAATLVLASCNQAPPASEAKPVVPAPAPTPAPTPVPVPVPTPTPASTERGGDAGVKALPPDHPPMGAAAVNRERSLAAPLCDKLEDCYPRSGVFGKVAAKVIATVGEGGRVTGVRVEGRDIPPKVRTCLTTTISGRRLAPEAYTPSEVTCEFSGGVMAGSRTLSGSTRFRRLGARPDGGVPASAPAGGAPAAPRRGDAGA
jgi:hypothetical protein